MSPSLSVLFLSLLGGVVAAPAAASSAAGVSCTGRFHKVSSSAWVSAANPGWNLGNTLEAVPTEGSWNNPPVQFSTFDDIKASGFKSIRVPVTWADHFTSGSPDWTINATWLQRVSDVVDAVIERDLEVLVNAHGDAYLWADVTAAGANYTAIEEQFYRLWYQVGTKLGCKSSLLAFEPINEPAANNQTHYDEINKLNALFVQALSDAGGFNKDRVLTLVGPEENGDLTDQFFKVPANISNPWALQYHYYSPYDFIFSAWGKTIWGADADKQALDTDLSIVRGNFTDVPILIGEWDASPANTETAARWKYFDFFIRTASKYKTSTIMWDNGLDNFDRAARVWRDPVAKDILMQAAAGRNNSLADSTTDINAASQNSSAYIFHKAGTAVTDQSLPYLFNGNTLKYIKDASGTLVAGRDYTVSGSNITYKAAYLAKYLSATGATGVKANLTLTFSRGAPLAASIVQYATPTLGSTSAAASSVPSGSGLSIPITWAGLGELAAVKATEADGTYLEDSWTQYLGPLQQGRMTYSSQFSWAANTVTLPAAVVQNVISAGQTTTFTFEFYPRVPGNAVNYTLTV